MKLLRQLYPQVLTALHRLGSLEREHSAALAFEEFLNRLPNADDPSAMES